MTTSPSALPSPADPAALDGTLSRRSWLAASGALLAGACASPQAGRGVPAQVRPRALDDVAVDVPRLMRLASVPGLSLAVVGRGAPVLRGFGVRRAGAEDAVTPDTIFEAASLTKPVFAYLVLRLADEGALDLDRPLREYLPLPNPADERAAGITARHALSHSGGWRNWRFARDHTLTADFAPGSRFSYSGEGFFFLQRVVEKVTGRGVAGLLRERVLAPLGMRSSSLVWRPELDAALAAPHSGRGQPVESWNTSAGRTFHRMATEQGRAYEDWRVEDSERALPTVNAEAPVFPNWLLPNVAASLTTTARDYAAFLAHLLGSDEGRAALARMAAPQVRINEALSWGLGWGVEEVGGRARFWHWGDNNGFKNFVIGDAAAGTAVVVFTNGNAGARVHERVVRALTGVDHPAFLWM